MSARTKRKVICGIYAIRCFANLKWYVGKSVNIFARWSEHKRDLRRSRHANPYLQAAWDKYGQHAFSFSVVSEVPEDQLNANERRCIRELNSLSPCGFNILEGGSTSARVPFEVLQKRKATLEKKHLEKRARLGILAGYKRCCHCGKVKLLSDFGKQRKNLDGRGSWCYSCCAQADRARHGAKAKLAGVKSRKTKWAEKVSAALPGTQRCTKCGEVVPLSEFSPDKRNFSGHSSWCRKCQHARAKKNRGLRKELVDKCN